MCFQIKESLLAAMAVLQLELPMLTANDWDEIGRMVDVLQIFDEVTEELSAEKVVTVSKILTLIEGIKEHLIEMKMDREIAKYPGVLRMLNKLEEKFASRSIRYDTNKCIAEATFLDPRFKKYGFASDSLYERTKLTVLNMASKWLIKLKTFF